MRLRSLTLTMTLLCLAASLLHSNELDRYTASSSVQRVQNYRADLTELVERIKQEHPRPYQMTSEPEFNRLVSRLNAQFDAQSSQRDVLWAFSEVLASVACGHTRMSYFNQENALIEASERFPLDVRLVDDRLLVIDALGNADQLSPGEEITAINGRAVSGLMEEIYRHIGADANLPYYKRHLFNVYATSYLTYVLGFPERYRVARAGTSDDVTLSPLESFAFRPLRSPLDPCHEPLCYRVDDASNVGIMTVQSFAYYAERAQAFTDFLDRAFADAVDGQRQALIIDLRGNQGGAGLAAAALLRRLASKPFDYFSEESDPRGQQQLFETQVPIESGFSGQIYLLMDGNTVSATPHFLALAREHGMATLVGEPAGGNHLTNDGSRPFTSSNLAIDYKIARMQFDVATPSLRSDAAILPDIPIAYSIEQTLMGRDIMLEQLLEIIASGD